MFGRNRTKGNYAYTATRAKAKKAKLLGEEDYNKLLQMTSTAEIAHYISDAGYSKEMLEYGDKFSGADLIERATNACTSHSFRDLYIGAQGELRTMMGAYLEFWENWSIKAILRGKAYGLPAADIKNDIVSAGCISAEEFDKLLAIDSVEEVLAQFCRSQNIDIPADVMTEFKITRSLGKIEDYLDKLQYRRIIACINSNSQAGRIFLNYIRSEIDILNIANILKLKVEGIYGEKVMEYVIPGGKQVDEKFARTFADAETVKAALPLLAQTQYYDFLSEGLEDEEFPVRHILYRLYVYRMMKADSFAQEYPLSILPVIDYMVRMDNEAKNIRTIARGIESGLDKDIIKTLLVI